MILMHVLRSVVQLRNKFSFSFETEEEANRAFHYIGEFGNLETSQPRAHLRIQTGEDE